MTDKEIVESNKLIAEFMELNYQDYDIDWRVLMPVIEKICRLKIGDGVKHVDYACPRTFGMLSEEGEIMVRLNGFQLVKAETLIQATWIAVVDFIKFQKEQSNEGKV